MRQCCEDASLERVYRKYCTLDIGINDVSFQSRRTYSACQLSMRTWTHRARSRSDLGEGRGAGRGQ